MKKGIIILAAISLIVLIVRKCPDSGTNVMGYKGIVSGVENCNTLVLNTGLKVWMLGVEPNHQRAEVWINNNLVGKTVELVSDSRNEQTFSTVGATVKAYVMIDRDGKKLCANRLLVADNRDCGTVAYMADSSFVVKDVERAEISDKALYMKQRTMLVQTESGSGTGFFINKYGVALTNHHVLSGSEYACVYLYAQDAEDAKVYSNRRRNIRNILWTDQALDITVFSVELENGEEVPYFNLYSRHEPVGSNCHILGNPQGLTASYAKGVISAYRDDEQVEGRKLVQYDISTNGGNSGGPVMNDCGEIIAVHSMGMKSQSNGAAAQGLNFGIDILQIRKVLDSPGLNVNYGGR